MSRIFFGLALCITFAAVIAEQFYGPVTSADQLAAEQEIQRHFGDIMIGIQQASGFHQMAIAKMQAASKNHQAAQSFLELKTEEEFTGFAGHVHHYAQTPATSEQLRKQSTAGKITALKNFYVQLMSTQSDVEVGYWVNKIYSAALPAQFAMFKLYKNYLSTFAVSSAIQLHDSFTWEAYLEDFNQNYPEFGRSAELTEAVTEHQLYQSWQSLATMRMYLFYIGIYESSYASQVQAQAQAAPAPAQAANPTFLEVDAEAEPAKPQDPQSAMLMQYTYMSYFSKMLKYYALFYEMMIPQYGSMMATTKVQALSLLTDTTPDNDEQGLQLLKHAEHLDNFAVPSAISQWSSMVLSRYYMEYYVLMFDLYLPQMAAARVYSRVDSAMLNTNMIQTEQPQTKTN
eukprot:c11153_g1_i1.p1 GENE.c11153_g1_i1~~c11153_g1_i1.p1  ORF type:complete len:400 (+),score=102.97 c11153_g1_i1:71-1270(+)